MVREDAGARPVASAAAAAHVRPSAAGEEASSGEHARLVAELERASANIHSAFLSQLRAYRSVEPWPMPVGYRERITPSYLAQVYRGGTTAVEYARRWLRDRGLMKCSPAQEMLSIMEAVDDAVLGREADVINTISFEKLARRAHGLERAFEGVHQETDWRRPQGALPGPRY